MALFACCASVSGAGSSGPRGAGVHDEMGRCLPRPRLPRPVRVIRGRALVRAEGAMKEEGGRMGRGVFCD